MSNRKMASVIAVGLVFSTGGHSLILDSGNAQASQVDSGFNPFQGPRSELPPGCDFWPGSGCLSLMPVIGKSLPLETTGRSSSGFCFAAEGSTGPSGIACLTLGD